MMPRERVLLLPVLVAILIGGDGVRTRQPALTMQVQMAPAAVVVDGVTELAYELHVANVSTETIDLRRLDVFGGTATALATFDADALRPRVGRTDGTAAASRLTLPAGAEATIYVELTRPSVADVPRALRHRLAFARTAPAGARDDVMEGGAVEVRLDAALVLASPVRGGPWAAVHNAAWERGHRRVFYTVGDRRRIPGRYAIDWIKLDADGRTSRGDGDLVASALGYGEDVLAVADAVVAAARDDVTEVARVSARRQHAAEDASGNFVALDVGQGRYVFYEHLKPGSVRVKAGERVRRGQTVAALGFTGDSTGPHLHLHVADAPSPLGAEGLPFVIDRFELLGRYPDIAEMGKARWKDAAGPTRRERERPGSNVVVSFEQ
jgi:murein DD-endopeptidase